MHLLGSTGRIRLLSVIYKESEIYFHGYGSLDPAGPNYHTILPKGMWAEVSTLGHASYSDRPRCLMIFCPLLLLQRLVWVCSMPDVWRGEVSGACGVHTGHCPESWRGPPSIGLAHVVFFYMTKALKKITLNCSFKAGLKLLISTISC